MKNFSRIIFFLFFINLMRLISSETIDVGNVRLAWTNQGNYTDFIVTSALDPTVGSVNTWLAFGFNSVMNPTNVVVCKLKQNNGSSIEHYFNNNFQSNPLVLSDPSVGITNARVFYLNGNLTCSFSRANSINVTNYFQINNQTRSYLIVAYGSLTQTADLTYHTYRQASNTDVTFLQLTTTTITTTNTTTSATSKFSTTIQSSSSSSLTSSTTASTTGKINISSSTSTTSSSSATSSITTIPFSSSSLTTLITTTLTTSSTIGSVSSTYTTTTIASTASYGTSSNVPSSSSTAQTTTSTTMSSIITIPSTNTTSTSITSSTTTTTTTITTTATSLTTTSITTTATTITSLNPTISIVTTLITTLSTTVNTTTTKATTSTLTSSVIPTTTILQTTTTNPFSNCSYNPCLNGASCIGLGFSNLYYCLCQPGYTGINCQINFVCNPNPCFNQATCIQFSQTAAYCKCLPGYTGSLCEIPCTSNMGYNCPTINTSTQGPCVDTSAFICQYYASVVTQFCNNRNYINGVSVFTYCAKTCASCY